jgi:predicted transcriptional regulator
MRAGQPPPDPRRRPQAPIEPRRQERQLEEIRIERPTRHAAMTAGIVSAYVSRSHVPIAELPALITSVHSAIMGLQGPSKVQEAGLARPTPAQVRKSVTPDALISFIDGKRYKTLKRHLKKHGLDMAAYCERYGLPHDYPSLAARYSEQRSALARRLGLGHFGRKVAKARTAETEMEASDQNGSPTNANA